MDSEFDPLHPFNHRFQYLSVSSTRRCAECGVAEYYHQHHEYSGYSNGACMRCFYPEHDIIHEFRQSGII